MGVENSKLTDVQYKSRNRSHSIKFKINDDETLYPPIPCDNDLETAFEEILSELILTPEQEELIRIQPDDMKWKLICRHRQTILKKMESINAVACSQAQNYLIKLKENSSLIQLDNFRVWLEEQATEDDLNSFIIFKGIEFLIETLETADLMMKTNSIHNYHKQMIILKIFEILITHETILDKLVNDLHAIEVIVMSFNRESVDLCSSVLEIFTALCWFSNEGHNLVLNALNYYKTEKKLKYPFQVFIDLLENEKNIVMIENMLTFINTLIHSPLQEETRMNIRSQLVSCGIKQINEVIYQ